MVLIPVSFFYVSYAFGEVYISDHFDNQADWTGRVDGKGVNPPEPWWNYGYYNSERIHISSIDDAHGSGKCLWIEWPTSMTELGLMTPTTVAESKSTLWVGFWFRHNAGWDWGGDKTYKWFYGPQAGGDRWMINFQSKHGTIIGDTRLDSNISFDTNDDQWHSFIIKMKHNTPYNYDGELRMWMDGIEVQWTIVYGTMTSNTKLMFNETGSVWDSSFLVFGFQSRPDWGTGNRSYFDDLIVASTREEVENFLGLLPSTPLPPSTPTHLQILE